MLQCLFLRLVPSDLRWRVQSGFGGFLRHTLVLLILLDALGTLTPAFLGSVEQVSTNETLSCPQTARRRTACRPFAGKSALRAQSARSMARDVSQESVEEVLKRPNKLDACARGTPPSPLQALQHLKHGHDLDEKAWHHLHVKKHEADMIDNGSRLRRSELFGEADTSARTPSRRAHERTTKSSTTLLRLQNFLARTAWQVRKLPRLSLPRRQLMLRMRQPPPQKQPRLVLEN